MKKNFKQLLPKITCFVFDLDGVLTDGSLIVMPEELIRTMNIRDGFAIHEAVKAGFNVVIISGGTSESAKKRLNNLGVKEIYMGVTNKSLKLSEVITNHKLKREQILYMGDDLPDQEVLKMAGVATCPYDAAPEIREQSIYISPHKGGAGCVRDVIEQVMRVQGKWNV